MHWGDKQREEKVLTGQEKEKIIAEEELRIAVRQKKIAPLLSTLVNGLGQVYKGEINKGLGLMFLSFLCTIGSIFGFLCLVTGVVLTKVTAIILFVLGIVFLFVLGLFSARDAGK